MAVAAAPGSLTRSNRTSSRDAPEDDWVGAALSDMEPLSADRMKDLSKEPRAGLAHRSVLIHPRGSPSQDRDPDQNDHPEDRVTDPGHPGRSVLGLPQEDLLVEHEVAGEGPFRRHLLGWDRGVFGQIDRNGHDRTARVKPDKRFPRARDRELLTPVSAVPGGLQRGDA